MNSGTIIFGFDDVIAPTSIKLFRYIRANWGYYSRWFWDPGELDDRQIYARSFYHMSEWLMKSKYRRMTSGEYAALQLRLMGDIANGFYGKDPYSEMEPTDFAKKTLMSSLYMEDPSINHIYILSRNITDGQKESKRRFIGRYLTDPKIEYLEMDMGRKGDYLNEHNIDFDAFIDDELPNVRSVVERFRDKKKREYVIPQYGYNKIPNELRLMIEAREGTVTYYDPFAVKKG